MAKKKKDKGKKRKGNPSKSSAAEQMMLNEFRDAVHNTLTTRSAWLTKLLDPRRDINEECGYPDDVTKQQYRLLYDREGIAKRVVEIWPEECWVVKPSIVESEDAEETEFEKAWIELEKEKHLFHYLNRIDKMSGIGRFGILLLGINDNVEELSEPVKGLDAAGKAEGKEKNEYEIIYIRAFDESLVEIDSVEQDITNPRYGQPLIYSVKQELETSSSNPSQTIKVHWTRIIHIADNRETSEIFGTPRLQVVYNRVYDLRKILSGSGEMFWKGAFPGLSIEVNPQAGNVTVDAAATRTTMDNYMNGLQRYLLLENMQAKSLAPQVADPGDHVKSQLENIAITIGVPKRIFFGAEQAKLASEQDAKTWNKRVGLRQNEYLSPMVVSPLVDRLIALGALPEPAQGYSVEWPDLNNISDEDRAKVAEMKTKALALYVSGNVEMIIPPAEYLHMIHGMELDEVEEVMKKLADFLLGREKEEELERKRLADEGIDPNQPSGVVPGGTTDPQTGDE